MLLIYTPTLTTRHKYIFKLFFDDIYHISYRITEKQEEFSSFNGAKLNYSNNSFSDEIFIESIGLLNEKGINQQEINVKSEDETPIYFKEHWVDTSSGGTLIREGIKHPVVRDSTWFIRYILLKFTVPK